MNLEQAVQEQFDSIVQSGQVESMIKNHLTKTVDGILNDMLREYGDFGKKLKEQLSKAMNIDLSRLDLLDYNSIVCSIVKEHLDGTIYENAKAQIDNSIKGYLGTLDKSEWKLSEITAKLIDELKSDDESGEIGLEVRYSDYGSVFVYIDKEKGRSLGHYESEFQLHLDKKTGKVYSFQAGKYKPTRGDWRERPIHGSFDEFIFKLYAMECCVIVDEEDCMTSWDIDY